MYRKLIAVSRIYSRIYTTVQSWWRLGENGRWPGGHRHSYSQHYRRAHAPTMTTICLITRTAFNTMLLTIRKYHNTTVAQSIQYIYSMCSGCTSYYKDHCPTATLTNHSSACELGTNNTHLHIYCHWATIRDTVNTC